MKFIDYEFAAGLKQSIQEAGFIKPTDIQFRAIPPIMRGEDVLGIAQTGTGKTAAFVIPVIHLLSAKRKTSIKTGPRCLVMVPTRELAIQIQEVILSLASHSGIKSMAIIGGVEQDEQIAGLLKGQDMVVATPGRMFDLVSQGFLKMEALEILILDEADHMLDLGFINDIRQLVKKLPVQRQTLFFSATINPEIKKLAYSLVKNPIRIQISPKDPVSKNIDHFVAYMAMDDKRFFLERLIRENPESKILVFVRTKVRAERVGAAMLRVGLSSTTLHGDKSQMERIQVLGDFRSGKTKLLIATDVSARGIDIPSVDFVINYDVPEKVENYVHRIGRTGRGNKRGQAVSFCSPEELPLLHEISGYLGKPVSELTISRTDYEETIDFSVSATHDWRSLINDAADPAKMSRKGRKSK